MLGIQVEVRMIRVSGWLKVWIVEVQLYGYFTENNLFQVNVVNILWNKTLYLLIPTQLLITLFPKDQFSAPYVHMFKAEATINLTHLLILTMLI